MKIESKDTDIETLLDGSYFHIPRFQRPYSWEEENINDFWNDLIANKDEEYFIGSMVVYKKAKQQYGVVDGQQRLTTITILLCVLRDEFQKLGKNDLAEGLHQLIERKDRDNKFEFVLKTETSFPYFQEHIQKFGKPELETNVFSEEQNLQNAHVMFKKLVQAALISIDADTTIAADQKLKNKIQKLISLRSDVLNLKLIFVTLDNEDDAYLIFETLNTRGKDLAVTDLIKNHFTKYLKDKGGVDTTKIKWSQLLEMIHNSSTDISADTFIYHFWASRYEAIPLKKLYPILKKHITKENAKEYLDSLLADAKLYRAIHEPSYEWSKNELDVSRSLGAIQLFKLSQPIPAILSLVRSYKNGVIKYGKLRDAILAIEKFHFIFTAVTSSRSSGGISSMYSAFAQKLFTAQNAMQASDEIASLVDKLRGKRPSLGTFKAAFKEIYLTNSNSKQKNLVRYILRGFSEHYEYKFSVDYDELTIEHVHPQSEIGVDGWKETNVGQLGNLLFIDQKMNGLLDTKSFNEKMKLMNLNNYKIPEMMINRDEWSAKDVESHTDNMAEVAYNKIWSI